MSSNLKNRTPVVAIAGATGAVGVELMECLEQRKFPLSELRLLASARSAGKKMKFRLFGRGEQTALRERLRGGANGSGRVSSGAPTILPVVRPDGCYQVLPSRRSSASRRARPTGSRTPPLSWI